MVSNPKALEMDIATLELKEAEWVSKVFLVDLLAQLFGCMFVITDGVPTFFDDAVVVKIPRLDEMLCTIGSSINNASIEMIS
jgi:hypothetical protein